MAGTIAGKRDTKSPDFAYITLGLKFVPVLSGVSRLLFTGAANRSRVSPFSSGCCCLCGSVCCGLIRPAAAGQAQRSAGVDVVQFVLLVVRTSHAVLLVACPAVVRRLLRVPEHCGLTIR